MSDAAPAPGVHELPNFYNGIVTPDEPVRAEELRAVREHLVAALDRDPAFVERHIGTIWRLSVQCPYEDVREVFAEVFQRCVVRSAARHARGARLSPRLRGLTRARVPHRTLAYPCRPCATSRPRSCPPRSA